MKRFGIWLTVLAVAWVWMGAASTVRAAESEARVLEVQVGESAYRYEEADLRSLATAKVDSTKGTKRRVAIPLAAIVEKAAGEGRELDQVVIIGRDRAIYLGPSQVPLLDELVVKFGNQHLSVVPVSDQAYERLEPVMGKSRLKRPRKIYVFPKGIDLPWPFDD